MFNSQKKFFNYHQMPRTYYAEGKCCPDHPNAKMNHYKNCMYTCNACYPRRAWSTKKKSGSKLTRQVKNNSVIQSTTSKRKKYPSLGITERNNKLSGRKKKKQKLPKVVSNK